MTSRFWKNKKVFITGHTGFKGSWLSLWLQSMGARVTGYSLEPPSDPNMFEIARVADGMQSIRGDVRDGISLKQSMLKSEPDVVLHLAAQSLVRRSYQEPVETYATNVMGTVNVLESVRHCSSVKAIVIVTSDKCYDNREWHWGYRENDAMGGFDPYSNSKGCAELVTSAYRSSFFNPKEYRKHGVAIASARAGNVIGGGDWAEDRLIPDMVRAFAKGERVVIRNPQSIRPWQHVLEPLAGYLLLAERLCSQGNKFAEAWNFGPDEADTKSVGWLVEHMAACWKQGASYLVQHDRNAVHEATYLRLDCSKARNKLGWQPAWNIEQAMMHLTEWYQAYLRNEDMRDFSLHQIQQYQEHRSEAWMVS